MIAIGQLIDEQFERHALDVLKRELGADGLARFLHEREKPREDRRRTCL